MAWRRGIPLEPEQGPRLSREELARRCDEYLKVLDAEQDVIYARIHGGHTMGDVDRMTAQYFYSGGPLDGKRFAMGPGALIPDRVLVPGRRDGEYVVDVERHLFEWLTTDVSLNEKAPHGIEP